MGDTPAEILAMQDQFMQDPDFAPDPGMTKQETALAIAKQRYRQIQNTRKALSMAKMFPHWYEKFLEKADEYRTPSGQATRLDFMKFDGQSDSNVAKADEPRMIPNGQDTKKGNLADDTNSPHRNKFATPELPNKVDMESTIINAVAKALLAKAEEETEEEIDPTADLHEELQDHESEADKWDKMGRSDIARHHKQNALDAQEELDQHAEHEKRMMELMKKAADPSKMPHPITKRRRATSKQELAKSGADWWNRHGKTQKMRLAKANNKGEK